MEKSKLLSTGDDSEYNKTLLAGTDVIESCARERVNTKWKFFKLTKVTIFAALLKDIPMGWKDAVLPEPLLKNWTVNCLTFEQNTRQPYNDNLCLFRALCLHLHRNERLEEETNKLFNLFLQKKDEIEPASFQGVCMDDIPTVEEISGLNICLYDVDIVEGSLVGEPARRSVQKHPNTVRLLRYNSHICYVANIHALFNAFRCTTCDCYFNRPGNLERHLTTCQERVKQVYPKTVYQLKETLFDMLDSFNIPYTDEQQLFEKVAIVDFESICVREDGFKDTETTRWIRKHVPISVSISSNLLQEPIFICNSNPRDLVSSFVNALESLAAQSRAQMRMSFLEIETAIESRLSHVMGLLNERRSRREATFTLKMSVVKHMSHQRAKTYLHSTYICKRSS